MQYFWPILLAVVSNAMYHICAKSIPSTVNPFASLTVSYAIGIIFSVILFFVLNKNANLIQEYKKINWASIVLGLSIVGLEVGFIYAYKLGWQVSTTQIIQAGLLSVILVFVGYILYQEAITPKKIAGVIVCIIGLVLLNTK